MNAHVHNAGFFRPDHDPPLFWVSTFI